MRLNLWAASLVPGSGIPNVASEQAEALAAHFDVARILESNASSSSEADLDLYHLGNWPAHGFVYRAALTRPGVVVLHDWNLEALVFAQAVEQGDVASYLRDMRRAHGEAGAFVARQRARGLGGEMLPSLYPLNHPVLEKSLGVVTFAQDPADRIALRYHDLPALALLRPLDAGALAGFLRRVAQDRERLTRAAALRRPPEGSLNARLLDEARGAAHELGLGSLSLGIERLLFVTP